MSIINFKNLTFNYPGYSLFKKISFEISKGEFVGIIGPNGGGKSTLIKLMLGLLPNYKGELSILNSPPGKHPHRIAYLPQSTSIDHNIPMTVAEIVLMGCLGHSFFGFYNSDDKDRASEAMKSLNIEQLAHKQFSSLSGGQKQRVLIARALTCHPQILLLDEPSSGIDIYNESILHDLLKELSEKMTIVMVSHHYNLVSSLVDKVLCVNHNVDIHYPQKIDSKKFKEIISNNYQYVEHHHGEEND